MRRERLQSGHGLLLRLPMQTDGEPLDSQSVDCSCVNLVCGACWCCRFAPFFSGGGYCSEAISFLQALTQRGVPVRIEQARRAV